MVCIHNLLVFTEVASTFPWEDFEVQLRNDKAWVQNYLKEAEPSIFGADVSNSNTT